MQLGANTTFELNQCITAFGGADYTFSVSMRMSTPSLLSLTRGCEFFDTFACGTPGTGIVTTSSTDLVGDTGGAWVDITGTVDTPVGMRSARCGFLFATPSGQDFTANLDDLFFGSPPLIFIANFEFGDLSEWVVTVP